MSVDILMATYNGGRYLRNQLLSLQQQTYADWKLFVRDDGSTDNTLEVLREFSERDSRIKIVQEDAGKGLGAGKNFIGLAKFSSAEYVIFCDQDDIWFEKKLERLVAFADKSFDPDLPSLVMCDGYGYSNDLGVITSDRVWLWYAKSLNEFLFFNAGYQGCNVLFNSKLNSYLKDYRADYFYMHDDVVSLIAHTFGRVWFVPERLMLYRQHESNVTGNIVVGFMARVVLFFRKGSFVLSGRHYKEKESFFFSYKEEMSDSARKLFNEYLKFPYCSFWERNVILFRNSFSLGGKRLPLYLKNIIRRPIE